MGYLLKTASTARPLLFPMFDATDGTTPETGLSPTVTLSKNGAAFSSPAGAVSEVGSGWYAVAGNATDTDTLGPLLLHATASGASVTDAQFEVVAFDPSDAADLGLTNLDAAVSTRLAGSAYVDHTAAIAAVQADTDNLQTRLPAALVSGRIDASVGAMAADTLTASALAADAGSEIGTAVWATGTRALTDKAGFSLSAAGVQAIWDALTSALSTVGSVGKLLVDNLNATVSSRASQASVDTVAGYVDTEVAAIKAKTDNLPASPANEATLTTIAGYVDTEVAAIKAKTDLIPASPAAVGSAMTLDLTQALSTGQTGDTVGGALLGARAQAFGRWVLSGTTLTLYAADGTTVVRTFTLDDADAPTSRT